MINFPTSFLKDRKVQSLSKMVFLYLHLISKDGSTFITNNELVEQLGTCKRSIQYALDELEKRKEIKRNIFRVGSNNAREIVLINKKT